MCHCTSVTGVGIGVGWLTSVRWLGTRFVARCHHRRCCCRRRRRRRRRCRHRRCLSVAHEASCPRVQRVCRCHHVHRARVGSRRAVAAAVFIVVFGAGADRHPSARKKCTSRAFSTNRGKVPLYRMPVPILVLLQSLHTYDSPLQRKL
jgi:hypothetical protein